MRRNTGGAFGAVIAVIVVVLICGTAFFGVSAVRNMKISDAEKLLASENYEEASSKFAEAEKLCFLKPDERVLRGLAKAALGMNDYESAKKWYTELASLNANDTESHFVLAQIALRQQDYGEAKRQTACLRAMGTPEGDRLASRIESESRKAVFMCRT